MNGLEMLANGKERQAASSSGAPAVPSSTIEMARESARRSPERRRASIPRGRANDGELLTLAMIRRRARRAA